MKFLDNRLNTISFFIILVMAIISTILFSILSPIIATIIIIAISCSLAAAIYSYQYINIKDKSFIINNINEIQDNKENTQETLDAENNVDDKKEQPEDILCPISHDNLYDLNQDQLAFTISLDKTNNKYFLQAYNKNSIEQYYRSNTTDPVSRQKVTELVKNDSGFISNKYNRNILMIAIMSGVEKFVTFILSKQLNDINYKSDNEGISALMVATKFGDYKTVETLLNYNAEINHQSNDKRTALIEAVYHDKTDIIELLLSREADYDAIDEEGNDALYYLMQRNNKQVCDALSESTHIPDKWQAGIKILTSKEYTTLHNNMVNIAATGTLEEFNKCLVNIDNTLGSAYKNINFGKEENNETALIAAAKNGNDAIVKFLLENIDTKGDLLDNDGLSAFLHASQNGRGTTLREFRHDPFQRQGWLIKDKNGNDSLTLSLLRYNDLIDNKTKTQQDLKTEKDGYTETLRSCAMIIASQNKSQNPIMVNKKNIELAIKSDNEGICIALLLALIPESYTKNHNTPGGLFRYGRMHWNNDIQSLAIKIVALRNGFTSNDDPQFLLFAAENRHNHIEYFKYLLTADNIKADIHENKDILALSIEGGYNDAIDCIKDFYIQHEILPEINSETQTPDDLCLSTLAEAKEQKNYTAFIRILQKEVKEEIHLRNCTWAGRYRFPGPN